MTSRMRSDSSAPVEIKIDRSGKSSAFFARCGCGFFYLGKVTTLLGDSLTLFAPIRSLLTVYATDFLVWYHTVLTCLFSC